MGSTFLSVHCHLVFATKDRVTTIDASWRQRLHEYLAGTCRGLRAEPRAIGGTEDHVHLLCTLPATLALADFVRELKKASCIWVHETVGDARFKWQEGYAAFSVSPTAVDSVCRYICGQEDHHRKRSFAEELAMIFREAGIQPAEYLETR